jgi:predicted metal-dependent phosphoesterase TrpH
MKKANSSQLNWYKGNLHTHSARSDGDISLDGVVHWYASRGYDWLAITDHNRGLNSDLAARLSHVHKILVIPGNELSTSGPGTVHVVGLGITEDSSRDIVSRGSLLESFQSGVDWIRDRGGVPILAHPNWGNVYGADVIAKIKDCNLFEVHNGAPDCNTFAAGGKPGTDDKWSEALNMGVKLFGVGADDSHHYLPENFHARHAASHGGEAWTYVQCAGLTMPAVLKALETGKCVASSGAYPVKVGLYGRKYVVEIDDPAKGFSFTTEFIGPDGVMARKFGRSVSFAVPRGCRWIRARVFCSSGRYLWCQPAWPRN